METVRRLAPGDEAVLPQLSAWVDRPPLDEEGAARFLANERNHLLVAFDDEQPVGMLLAHELDRRHGDDRKMFLYEIDVREDRRRRGIGRALMDELARLCRERGYANAWVLTDEQNPAAMSFYAACGGTREQIDQVMFVFRYAPETSSG
jgi:[ribosomal protein S18]-alanine N-acetyltransferase